MLASLVEIFPDAPIFTLLYDERATKGLFKGRLIHTSFLQRFPMAVSHHEWYPALMPLAMEQFDFSKFDVVISISASFAKGVITKPHTRHICYCLTPPRFLWDNSQQFGRDFGFPFFIKFISQPAISYLRAWDHSAADRPDEFWRISNLVGKRIDKYYRRPSVLVYPPVEIDKFPIATNEPSNYFLMVGRLVSYKKFDIAIRAFNELNLPLKIIGIGPEFSRLRKLAKSNIEFLGQISDEDLSKHYQQARAVIFPQEEDFGIVPLEAMSSGRPVIAYGSGGATETVIDGETGIFFNEQSSGSIIEAVKRFNDLKFETIKCRAQAEKFSVKNFQNQVKANLGL